MSGRRSLFLAVMMCLGHFSELRCTGECPEGWVNFRGHSCIKTFLTVNKNWPVAETICRAIGRGSHLVKIKNEADNLALSELVVPNSENWIGLNDITTETDWTWVGDQREAWTAGSDYSAFSFPQPDNWGNDEDCVSFKLYASNGLVQWNDLNCNTESHFICQQPLQP